MYIYTLIVLLHVHLQLAHPREQRTTKTPVTWPLPLLLDVSGSGKMTKCRQGIDAALHNLHISLEHAGKHGKNGCFLESWGNALKGGALVSVLAS